MEETQEIENGKELLLDTKGSCFFCLKETGMSDTDNSATATIKEFCVRNICKYLNINPSLALLKILKDRELTKEEMKEASDKMNNYDYSVMLCSTCADLAAQLTKLIHELEMTKMMMNLKLQQFHKVLTTSEHKVVDGQDQPRWEKFKEKMTTSEEPGKALLVEMFRNQAKKNCCTQFKKLLETSYPKVSLKRLPRNPQAVQIEPSSTSPPPPTPLDSDDSEETPPNSCSVNAISATDTSASQETPLSTKASSTSVNDSLHKQNILNICTRHSKRISPGSRFKCTICNNTFSRENKRFPQHVIGSHPEKIFLHPALQDLGKLKLWTVTAHFLFTEGKKAEQKTKSSSCPSRKNVSVQCAFCCQNYSRGYEYKFHLVLDHFGYVEQQMLKSVESGQSTTLSVENESWEVPSAKRSRQIKRKRITRNNPVKTGLVATSCPKAPLKRLRKTPQAMEAEPSPATPTSLLNAASSKVASQEMPSTEKSALTPIPNSNTIIICPTDPDFLNKQRILTISQSHYKLAPTGSRYKCTICNSTFSRENKRLPHHIISSHPEIIFLHETLQNLGKLELWKLTTSVLQMEGSSNETLQCAFCPQKYSRGYDYKYHLVLDHFSYVEQQMLKSVQLSASKTLSVANSGGVEAELVDEGNQSQTDLGDATSMDYDVEIVEAAEEKPVMGEEVVVTRTVL